MDLHVDIVFSRSVEYQFREFKNGFLRGCPSPEWKMFLPDQLMTLLKGEEIFNWDDLRQVRHPSLHQTPQEIENRYFSIFPSFLQNAEYQGCTANDEVVQNFWTVFAEFSVEQKKDFLSK